MTLGGWLIGMLAAGAMLLVLYVWARKVPSLVERGVDAGFFMVGASWAAFVVTLALSRLHSEPAGQNGLLFGLYQLTAVATATFLLKCMPGISKSSHLWAWAYLFLSELLVAAGFFIHGHMVELIEIWRGANFAASTLLMVLALRVLIRESTTQMMVVSGGVLIGWSTLISDMANMSGNAVELVQMHYLLAAYLAITWLIVTGRLRVSGQPAAETDLGAEQGGIGEPEVAGGEKQQASQRSGAHTADDRRRIAQDLHDGVGSQIVSIISSLDDNEPEQHELMLALEQCLLDLKSLIDEIDDSDESVQESLGRLRYRVQHSLNRMGMHLTWSVEVDGPLGAMRANPAKQVMHVARESLANTMRHSRANHVAVRLTSERRPLGLLLEIEDDGIGFSPTLTGKSSGRGLPGMHRRIASIGGELQVFSEEGRGTLVRARVPLAHLPNNSMGKDMH